MVWCVNSSHSIIAERCKGKQTNLHSLSLKNQILRHVHSIGYNNMFLENTWILCFADIKETLVNGIIFELSVMDPYLGFL